jgi:hypothetical protein
MQHDLSIGSVFSIGPGVFTEVFAGSIFQYNGVSFFSHALDVATNFTVTTFDDGDQNSSYKKVFYLYAGRYRR